MNENFSSSPVIEMCDASVGTLRDPTFVVVENVNWSVQPGEFWVVAGQPQSGKSNFLMTAAGLLFPAHGSCRVFGCETKLLDDTQLEERLRIGFGFAGGQLFNQLTVAENVALPLRYQKNLSADEAARDVESLLELLELKPFADATPLNLAPNWRQRTALARALILKPELLLLDNPLAGLVTRHHQSLLQFLDQLWRGHEWFAARPMTLVVATDDLRPWRSGQKKFAVLHDKNFTVTGDWKEMASTANVAVKELLAEPTGTTT